MKKPSLISLSLVASFLLALSCLPRKKTSLSTTENASSTDGCNEVETVIKSLKSGSTLPTSILTCESKKLAELLVRNLSHKGEGLSENTVRSSQRVMLDQSRHGKVFQADAYQIEIRFNPFIMESVMQKGVLNQHQLGVSLSASVDPERRARLEDHIIGFKLEESYKTGMDNPVNNLRPKYGYLNAAIEMMKDPISGKERQVYFRNSELDAYGCVAFRFKKEVNSRSTWTFGDSLAQFDEISEVPTKVNLPFWFDPPRTLLNPRSVMPTVKVGREIKYLEAQVWGPLVIQDVESIIISERCGFDGDNSTPQSQANLIKVLRTSKLPILRIGDGVVDKQAQPIPPRLRSLENNMPPDKGFLNYIDTI